MDSKGLTEEQQKRIEENKRLALLKRQHGAHQPPQTAANPVSSFNSGSFNSNASSGKPLAKPALSSGSHTAPAPQNTGCHTAPAQQAGDHVNRNQPTGNQFSRNQLTGNQFSRNQQTGSQQTGNQFSKNQPSGNHTGNQFSKNQPAGNQFSRNQSTGNQFQQNKGQFSGNNSHSAVVQKQQFYGAPAKTIKGQCVLISRDRFEVNIGFHQATVEVFKSIKSRIYDAGSRKWHFHIREHDSLLKAVSGLRPEVEIEPLPKAILQVFGKLSSSSSEQAEKTIVPQADLSQVDSVLVDSLMPFQREGVNFGVHLNGRVLIADDMGLGKTLQAICLACVYRQKWPLLVVTPSSVRFDWAQQFKRWVPSLDPERIQVAVTGKDNPAAGLVNIISYDLLSRKAKQLTGTKFQVIIMDESHFLKNFKTVRTKAALPLLQAAKHVILLSGTPALSRPSELYTQIVAVYPYLFKFHEFGVRYCDAKQQPWGWDYSGSSNMGELQLLLEEKVMIRRLKRDVLSQLPAKRRQMVLLDPVSVATSRALIEASKTMEKKLTGMQKRGALLQYFHETCRVKLNAVRDYVMDMVAAEKKFIIFAHHQEMLDSIEDTVSKEGVEYIRIDGRTTSEQRNFFCRKFQSRDECRVAVLSITAANAGLNLSAASTVIFAELFWNPGILVQAEDRAHRLGQQDSVLVYYLVAQKTADDYVWPLVQNKLQVLGKAGLAKDDFRETDTTHMKDPKQKRLMDMFEESFIEETPPEQTDAGQDNACMTEETSTSNPAHLASSPVKRPATATSQTKAPAPGSHLSPSKGQTGYPASSGKHGNSSYVSPRKRVPDSNWSPSKREPGSYSSPRKRPKWSPGKGQTAINQFFPVNSLNTTCIYPDADTADSDSLTGAYAANDNFSGANMASTNKFSGFNTANASNFSGANTVSKGSSHAEVSAEQCADLMEGVSAEEWDDEMVEEQTHLAADLDWDEDAFESQLRV